MTPSTYIRIRNTAGSTVAVLTGAGASGGDNGYLNLAWRKKRNGVDSAAFKLAYRNPDAQYLVDKYVIEVVRSDPPDIAEYVSFSGLLRDVDYYEEKGVIYLLAKAFGANHLLTWREILYPADTANRTLFSGVPAETVLKNLVKYNCTALGTTADGRDRLATITGLSVATDNALGNSISYACTRKGLLETLQDIALIAGGDFALEFLSPTTYVFRFYPGQLGTDRTSGSTKVEFSLANENMRSPKLSIVRSTEKTVAIIGGQGTKGSRTIRTRNGPNYNVSTNNIEHFVDGKRTDNTASLDGIGDAALQRLQATTKLTYEVIQTPNYRVETDYYLGDKVLGSFAGVTATQYVDAISFSYDPGSKEEVDVDTVDV